MKRPSAFWRPQPFEDTRNVYGLVLNIGDVGPQKKSVEDDAELRRIVNKREDRFAKRRKSSGLELTVHASHENQYDDPR